MKRLNALWSSLTGEAEIVYGSATIDHDGSLLYSSYAEAPPGSAAPGELMKLGHGDALHVGHFDPDREGMEIWSVHEGGRWAPYGYVLRDAATGEILHGAYSGTDVGRGMVGGIDPDIRGYQLWAFDGPGPDRAGMWTVTGEHLGAATPGTNLSIRWAGDMTTQIVNGAATTVLQTPTVDDWKRGTLLTAEGTLTNNWTKGNPGLVADVLGDWREELLLRTADSSAIRIHLSTELTDRKLYTLTHDAQYRVGVAWQQTTYNQPTHPSFYFASDTDWSQVPVPEFHAPGAVHDLRDRLAGYVDGGEIGGPAAQRLASALDQAARALEKGDRRRAAAALDRFLAELAAPRGTVSEPATAALRHHAERLRSRCPDRNAPTRRAGRPRRAHRVRRAGPLSAAGR